MEQLSGLDASFVYRELPHAPLHVGTVLVYDPSTAPGGQLSFNDVVAAVSQRLHLAKAFRRRLVPVPMDLDHPWWVEDAGFDLSYHVRRASLPAPGGERELWALAARLFAAPLDLSRPPWAMHVVEGLAGGRVAVVQKIHHAAVDGLSGMEILGAIHDRTADGPPPTPARDEWRPEREPAPWELVGRANLNAMARPMHGMRVLRRAMPRLNEAYDRMTRRELVVPETTTPPTRFNGPIGAGRVFEGRSLDLTALRRARRAVAGASVNDVLLSIVGAALHDHLGAEAPDEPLVAMVPLSVRRKDGRGAGGNQVTTLSVPLGTPGSGPVERLAQVAEATKAAKELASAVGARDLVELSEAMPGALVALGARTASLLATAPGAASHTCVVTNVPGPRSPIYLAGAELVLMQGMTPPADGLALTHTIVTYRGTVAIGVVSTPEALPDPIRYGDALALAAAALVDAAGRT